MQLGGHEERAQHPVRRRRAAVAQRIGWGFFATVVAAALAGLLGPGPLSWARRSVTTASGSIEMRYDRFARHVGDTTLNFHLTPDPRQPHEVRIWISAGYLSGVRIETMQPQPARWMAEGGGYLLVYDVVGAPTGQVTVRMQVQPDQVGLLRGAVGASPEASVEFWQFIYP